MNACVCVSLREIVLYANFVYLSWQSKARKVRLTVEGTSIYKTREGNSVRFFRYVDANEHRCCVANERGQFYWLTTNKSTTNVAISANSQDHCSCKCSSCLHPYRYSLHTRLYIYRIVACFIMLVEVKRAFAASLESRTCRYSRVTAG